ncbi:MAG: HupE/UreJ family protein [Pseudomonadota bacterium]
MLDPLLCEELAALDRADDNTARSVDLPDNSALANRSIVATFVIYLRIGIDHILPGGLDHILFVIALVLTTTQLRPLAIQITAFTLAHTVTLGLASAGVVSPSAQLVEPLIAASIAFVALENLWASEMSRWRPFIVFGFGLLHGLGFAGFIGELGLPTDRFWSALIGFNVGVELGQLSVVVITLIVLLGLQRIIAQRDKRNAYRRWAVIPGSALIGITGLWWTVERLVA